MNAEGKYIYCIVRVGEEKNFGPVGIGGRGDEVATVCEGNLGVVVSSSPVIKYSISRENTLAHQLVMEKVMGNYPILPVRFSTIAEAKNGTGPEDRIKEKVLKARYSEFEELLAKMGDKVELGVKALWTDMNQIYMEIVKENSEIRRLREKIAGKPPLKTQPDRINLGEMVKSALDAKREREKEEIFGFLKELSFDSKENKIFGDNMILNVAFLVEKVKEKEFDYAVSELGSKYSGRTKIKYVGPIPPCNFVELVVTLD
ncbi:MAG: GvpL/GvpF family gas vesicle protein [Candidatus Saganbacteria bacterium]|nr:GvpL/GvpF family gas vesicle protein [Candidatus Saganbacteria bacterium]